jgi:hypothetical protein
MRVGILRSLKKLFPDSGVDLSFGWDPEPGEETTRIN